MLWVATPAAILGYATDLMVLAGGLTDGDLIVSVDMPDEIVGARILPTGRSALAWGPAGLLWVDLVERSHRRYQVFSLPADVQVFDATASPGGDIAWAAIGLEAPTLVAGVNLRTGDLIDLNGDGGAEALQAGSVSELTVTSDGHLFFIDAGAIGMAELLFQQDPPALSRFDIRPGGEPLLPSRLSASDDGRHLFARTGRNLVRIDRFPADPGVPIDVWDIQLAVPALGPSLASPTELYVVTRVDNEQLVRLRAAVASDGAQRPDHDVGAPILRLSSVRPTGGEVCSGLAPDLQPKGSLRVRTRGPNRGPGGVHPFRRLPHGRPGGRGRPGP